MKRNKMIYWAATGLLGVMMLFSAYGYLTNPQLGAAFGHLGFPAYFRVELGIAKLIGAVLLLLPQVPLKVKEWTYAGFAITFVSAIVAHASSGDGIATAVMPGVFLVVLLVSNIYLHKTADSTLQFGQKVSA
jgi:hypothetical protein